MGLYDYGARYYDPELRRFIQPDSYLGDTAVPQSLNRYAYVWNNPLRYVDPSGHWPHPPGTTAFFGQPHELLSTSTFAAGVFFQSRRAFSEKSIARMRDFFIANAKSARKLNCIECANRGLRLLLGDLKQAVGSQVDLTMAKLRESGHASKPKIVEFVDASGRMTTGATRPHTLSESIGGAVLKMSREGVGHSVYVLSIMDGLHSVILTVKHEDRKNQIFYYSDQWPTNEGWRRFKKDELDTWVTQWTQTWWDRYGSVGQKHKTRATIWQVIP